MLQRLSRLVLLLLSLWLFLHSPYFVRQAWLFVLACIFLVLGRPFPPDVPLLPRVLAANCFAPNGVMIGMLLIQNKRLSIQRVRFLVEVGWFEVVLGILVSEEEDLTIEVKVCQESVQVILGFGWLVMNKIGWREISEAFWNKYHSVSCSLC